ncbi:MAG: hypothetical protein K9J16_09760 [Melioribacteraceae bacterium]|nr:hypothetical protein [Melioribacteraceae bacterium]MCF8356098.1 hypothetical protein [Melioribacteraceae bacterium]MCF8395582.1 hypothetical protein [Melioribacteraceae bacterium]MCF8419684.1 hypothetical protein [Melioribacteraceae bacterium]
MGQQQLLLIVLGVIIVGLAIILGITYFRQQAIDSKRDAVINECITIGNYARGYYKKPTALGGGGNKFTGFSIPPSMRSTGNGSYSATIYADSVVLIGTGNEVVTGNDSVQVKVTVTPDTYRTKVVN